MLAENGGIYPTIEPIEIPRAAALCKQVVLTGEEIDVTSMPFLQNNPGDSGRYINTTSVFTVDPELGLNIGTYRCELKGPQHISVGAGVGQTGFNMLMAARERGQKSAPIALVLGMDPMTWLVSGARIPERRGKKPVDELATAGGMRGKAIDVIKCDTNDIRVPAHAEMIIEGEVTFDSFESNGPYGEGYGYIGAAREKSFTMNVTRITHRENPWFVNNFTGVTESVIEMPGAALTVAGLKFFIPEITDFRFLDSVTFISIEKTKPGQALEIGKTHNETDSSLQSDDDGRCRRRCLEYVRSVYGIRDALAALPRKSYFRRPADAAAGTQRAGSRAQRQDRHRRNSPMARGRWPKDLPGIQPTAPRRACSGNIRSRGHKMERQW